MIPIDKLRPAKTTPTIDRLPTKYEGENRAGVDWLGWGLVVLVCAGAMGVAVSL